jgi:hypothetical protein
LRNNPFTNFQRDSKDILGRPRIKKKSYTSTGGLK